MTRLMQISGYLQELGVARYQNRPDTACDMLQRLDSIDFPINAGLDINSSEDKLIMHVVYNRMRAPTKHTVTVLPTFGGYRIVISGRDRSGSRAIMHSIVKRFLDEEVTE